MNDDSKFGSGVAILAVVLATVWLFMFPALALFCWFMPVYTAIRYGGCGLNNEWISGHGHVQ